MFIGHYGPAALATSRRIKLWHGFLAVQFLDILWAPLTLVGVERFRIVEDFTASNHLDLHYIPWTHSLPMAVFWSLIAAVFYRTVNRPAGRAGAFLIGALVFSHWLLDYVTHRPDLEIWFGGEKVGLGLWMNRPLAFSVEAALFLGGLLVFTVRSRAKNYAGAVSLVVLAALGLGLQVVGNFGAPPPSTDVAAGMALAAYGLFILAALFVDRTRKIKLA